MNIIAALVALVLMIVAMVGALAVMAMVAMGVWALIFVVLAWLLPEMAASGRTAAGLTAWEFWQIGAAIGFLLFLVRVAFSSSVTVSK